MMTDEGGAAAGSRPPVSVVVPFAGGPEEAAKTVAGLARLRLAAGDEVVLADNSAGTAGWGDLPEGFRVVEAAEQRSSYYARNAGAEAAVNEWLLFVDADCVPEEGLLDAFFEPPPSDSAGALAGAVVSAGGESVVERWSASRRPVSQEAVAGVPGGPAAVTANLLVRRAAWRAIGGFCEGIRSGGDLDFCWRLADGDWALEPRAGARVSHRDRATLGELARQMRRYGAGNAWQNRRRPGSSPAPPALRTVPRMLGAAVMRAVRGRSEDAAMAAIDGVALSANALGRLSDNAAYRSSPVTGARSVTVFVDRFPVASETFVASEARALVRQGWRVRVEAVARPQNPLLGGARGLRVDYLEDDGPVRRLAALARVLARHPLRSLRDLLDRGRWPPGERMPLRGLAPVIDRLERFGDTHAHVHFASPVATHALRAGRVAGVPVSIAAHAYEIYAKPSGLGEKLAAAEFVAASCEYTRRDLQAMLDGDGAAKVHTVIMGVDGERFRRTTPYPGGRTVLAIGRYVEKKGFADLIEAARLLADEPDPVRVVIAGDGPLRPEFERRIGELGIGDAVELPTAPDSDAVRDLLEGADLLAMPCVVAADGDRDSMPVVVKEALAMELPVVATDEVGLPEMVRPEWGRLVAPADPPALAAAISELLALPAAEREAMGRAGRAFVLEHCDVGREARRLAGLISGAGGS